MEIKVDLVKYNRERLPEYRTETMVCSQGAERWVVKRPLGENARGHVEGMVANADLLRKRLPAANVPKTVLSDGGVRMDFIRGRTLESTILLRAARGDRQGTLQVVRDLRTYLETLIGSERTSGMTGAISDILTDSPTDLLGMMMPVANIDLTPDNILIDEDGRYWMTDHEWVFDSPVPLSFILYRSLYVLFLKHDRRLSTLIQLPDALEEAGVDQELWEPYRAACERFIDLVLGKDRPNIVPAQYHKRRHRLADLEMLTEREQQLYAVRLELETTRNALDETVRHGRLREERLHDQERRLGEQSDSIESLKASLAEKDVELTRARVDLESERMMLAATHSQLEIEKDHAYKLIEEIEAERSIRTRIENELRIALDNNDQMTRDLGYESERRNALLAELKGEQVLTEQLRREIVIARNDLRIAMEAMARKERELEVITKERDEDFVRLQDMTEKFMGKQAELMTMSDWARSMQLRLEFLESIPTIKLAERVAKVQKLGVEKLRSDGVVATVKGAALKAAPQKVQQMFYRQTPSNMKELEEDSKGRDLLVVFPVIPWEFRWQRPQQLVSRFAEHGYTVVFVNMTLNPKGARYLNDAEALKDVGLGKLRDHVFEVRLSTFEKVNVYQDRLKGADLSNVAHGLLSVLRELDFRSVTYLVQFPGWGQLANLARAKVGGTLIFDCMDDHAGFSNNATEVVKRETKLMESADLVVASSAKLHEKALAFNQNSILVRNGTDFDMFHTLFPNGKLEDMKHPIIGYHGAISEWFDPGVVHRCAEKHPDWNFVLIGSTLGCEVNGLKKLPNVHLLGEMPYRDLPGYLHYFDACIIPFKVCELTLATNPVKFYEYISSGKPVVSVRLPEMEQYSDICYLYLDDEEFEKGIIAALAEKDERLRAKRIDVARNSSWDQRFLDISEHLRQMAEGKKRKVL